MTLPLHYKTFKSRIWRRHIDPETGWPTNTWRLDWQWRTGLNIAMEASFDVEYVGKILGSYHGRIRKPITHISTGWLARNLTDGHVILQGVEQWLSAMRK